MVRNSRVEFFDDIQRPLIALGNDFPSGHKVLPHSHRRHQLLYGASGTVVVGTVAGTWMIPPQHGMWIPSGVVHDVLMRGDVATHSLYLEPNALDGVPKTCQVVSISPFMRNLMMEAVDLPVEYDPESRAGALMTLIQHELRQLPERPLALPLPIHAGLMARCQTFLTQPTPHEHIDAWSADLGLSRRAFTRLFRSETGLSFVAWRQQACLLTALPRLIAGEPVTLVALDLGYDNPAAFTAMFKRSLGLSPRHYFKQYAHPGG
jgi:AraC-like DNA-binding protein